MIREETRFLWQEGLNPLTKPPMSPSLKVVPVKHKPWSHKIWWYLIHYHHTDATLNRGQLSQVVWLCWKSFQTDFGTWLRQFFSPLPFSSRRLNEGGHWVIRPDSELAFQFSTNVVDGVKVRVLCWQWTQAGGNCPKDRKTWLIMKIRSRHKLEKIMNANAWFVRMLFLLLVLVVCNFPEPVLARR